ncbi:MAG TPA: hypothetical protein VFZ61_18420 [Polyangiales bacterium]
MPGIVVAKHKLFLSAAVLSLIACGDGGDEDATQTADEGSGVAAVAPAIDARQERLLGSNACKNADIRVLNQLDFPITVRSLDYYNGSETRWQHEDLNNKVVSPGAMEFWTPTFSNTDNDWIYSFDVHFDHDEDADGNPIATHAHVYHVNTPDQRCNTGVVYLLEIL